MVGESDWLMNEIRSTGSVYPIRRLPGVTMPSNPPAPRGPEIELFDSCLDSPCLVPNKVTLNGQEMLVVQDGVRLGVADGGLVTVTITFMPSKLTVNGRTTAN